MNDHRNHRYRASEPAWPTGDDPDFARDFAGDPARREQPQERTGFWSPLWEDDDDDVPVGNRSRSNGHRNGRTNGSHSNGRATQWPTESDTRAAGSRRTQPPPRPAPRSGSAPAWPSQEPPPVGPPPGRGGLPNGARPPAGPPPRIARPRPAGPSRHSLDGPIPDGPTELLPPVAARTGPEPQLLTHREPDYDEDLHDDPDLDEDYEDGPLTDEQRRKRRKKIWRRVRRTAYTFIALMIIVPIVGFFIAYQIVEVPPPQASGPQSVTLRFANGTTMAKLVPPGGENRTMVKYADIPEHVLNAVYAAEDADFKTNPGFDISGVMRAAWNQVSGGEGGGSTITQQYIKKATGNEEKSVTRKALEIVKAYKMNNTYTKEEIITAYLNTVYFGRSAYGIAAAAQAYYGSKPLKEISPSEAALLAGMIQSPGRYKDQPYMEKRWNYVMDQMVDKKWLSAADRKAAKFPTLIPVEQARPKGISGPRAHIQRAVFEELEREAGLSEDEIYKGGLTIKTTIQDPIQAKAEAAVSEVLDGEPDNLRTAMVAVNPKNGEILAYYGGKDGAGQDWAQVRQEPGSSFKPFDLVALLQQGKGLGETYDGSNGREFGNITVNNSEGGSCGKECTVKEAMRKSINTVFYDMALNTTTTQKVADAAHAAGIKSPLEGANGGPPDGNIAIGGGTTQVSTYEMASAYATFAAQGTYRKPHLVTEVLGPEGGVYWKPDQASLDGVAAFDKANAEKNKKIARNVTEALEPVLDYADLKCADGRECAGKTGTHQLGETEDNAKAWMVGYTPQVSAAVSMTAEDEQGHQMPVKNAREGIVYGSGLPGEIWQKFMDSYLDGAPKEGFGKYEPIGKDAPKKTSSQQKPSDQSDQPPTQSEQPPSEPEDPTTDPSEPEEPTDPGPTIIPTFPNNNGRGNDPPDGS